MSKSNFELNFATRRQLGYELIDLINDYFESLPTRPVQAPRKIAPSSHYATPCPKPAPFRTVTDHCGMNGDSHDELTAFLRQTAQDMIARGFHLGAANYFGLMNPTPTYAGVLAEALVAALNPQLATTARSQLATKIEAETIRWIGERFGWQQPFDGYLHQRRQRSQLQRAGVGAGNALPASDRGGRRVHRSAALVYASAESHHSLDKSVGLLGLGRKALHRIPLNERCAMDASALEQAIAADRQAGRKPFCVVATAGTTNSGIIDDIPAIADLCQREGLWLHLDGAYGAAVTFSDTYRHLVNGIERCDSVTIDPHKWLAVPFVAGVMLTRRPQAMQAAFGVTTPYMPKAGRRRAARQLQGVDAVDAAHELAQALAHAPDARTRGLPGAISTIKCGWRVSSRAWVESSEAFELATPQVLPILNLRLKHGGERRSACASPHRLGRARHARRPPLDLRNSRRRTQRNPDHDRQLPDRTSRRSRNCNAPCWRQ